MNFFQKAKALDAATAQLATLGLDLPALLAASGEAPLAAAITALAPAPALNAETPAVATLIAAATAPLQEQLDQATGALETAYDLCTVLKQGLVASGVKFPANAAITPEALRAAIETRAATLAAEQLAKRGLPAADLPEDAPAADATRVAVPSVSNLTGLARATAAIQAARAA
jgi:hypothetical protein